MVTLINRINSFYHPVMVVSAEKLYHQRAIQLTNSDLFQIKQYYENCEEQQVVDLKFRFVKFFGWDESKQMAKWYNLHHLLNIRRLDNSDFPRYMQQIIEDNIYPLRIFQSCTEWLAPNEVELNKSARIIRSGFIPIENDTDLETSLIVACKVAELYDEVVFIYSGNKSIHSWISFELSDLEDETLAFADRREQAEKTYRKEFYEDISKKLPYPIDRRISTDSRRVVPMPETLNVMTWRKVNVLDINQLLSWNVDRIKEFSRL